MKEAPWELKEFMEKIASDAGHKYAEALESSIEESLSHKGIRRMIVWAAKRKHLLLGKLLSRIVGLEIRITRSPIDLGVRWEVIYAGRCINQRQFGIDE